jgi:hypothetical protein
VPWPLAQREIAGLSGGPGLFDRIIDQGLDAVIAPTDPPDLTGYLELATAGDAPLAVLEVDAPSPWGSLLPAYLDQLATRDVGGKVRAEIAILNRPARQHGRDEGIEVRSGRHIGLVALLRTLSCPWIVRHPKTRTVCLGPGRPEAIGTACSYFPLPARSPQ